MKKFKLLTLVTALSTSLPLSAIADDYAVIVHEDNGYSSSDDAMRNEIRLLYLKQKFRWGGGNLSLPIGPEEDSAAEDAFQERILQMSDAQLSAHWVKIKQLNGDSPPRTVSSERLVSRLVARDKGSFGVVTKKTAEKAKNVKVLFTF